MHSTLGVALILTVNTFSENPSYTKLIDTKGCLVGKFMKIKSGRNQTVTSLPYCNCSIGIHQLYYLTTLVKQRIKFALKLFFTCACDYID